ncbi:MAG: hypothetical protein E6K75_00285 [Candidatus Eisenbacteria bacterium]|uniref:Uncharacterized protein n=1 Tax=Eiseniibacteriota bacterium TaxID=2212470 RepID=A0A538TEQ6_UNCEI|nr:MAG: hypothetical protein E6K71_02875 [Candidatus Eisenbacteria bacterium]TMQ62123.1 MAG: hypothetical protein E6K75_00285 [Candidatus Eisenbacteria bacterium]
MSPEAQFWIETIALWQPLSSAFLFVWGAGDPVWLLALKRIFLVMPLGAVALAYWTTVLSVPTIVVRAKRRMFVNQVLVTWWDLARATFTFWGGVLRFMLRLVISLMGAVQILVMGVWALIQELVLLPLRLIRNVGANALSPGVPWIAVAMTFFWCVFEATIFTYVMTSLVIDTLSNLAGTEMTEAAVRIPLFLFMFFIVLGSYAVLSTFTAAVRSRDWPTIVKIGVVELVAMFVEVVFLYREFVDALVPWFAQHTSGNFELGIVGTLAIAGTTWLGIRSLSWFLFANSGTPTIMAIISRQGVGSRDAANGAPPVTSLFSESFTGRLRKEFEWVATEGERLLDAFLVPPMQVVAAALNFVTLLVANRHLLDLPLQSVRDFKDARTLAKELTESRLRKAA